MIRTVVTRKIEAPIGKVFRTVADFQHIPEVMTHIVKVEFLTERREGVGTRYRETRLVGGKEVSTVLEVTEYVENDRIRLVSDAGGTIWDTVLTVAESGSEVELTVTMDAKAYRLLPRLLNPLFRGMFQKAAVADLDSVKACCEKMVAF